MNARAKQAEHTLYVGVIGDLIASRKLPQRAAAQAALQAALDAVNARFAAHLAARFVITLGDEFQGLLKPSAPVFEILDVLEARLGSQPCRFGVGVGAMATPINPDMSIGADGPAFWHARDAITSVHEQHDYQQTRTRIRGLNAHDEPIINNLLALSDHIKRGWTALQRETFAHLLTLRIYTDNFDQQSAAEDMGITAVALYRRLKISGIKVYLRSRADLNTWLIDALKAEAGA